jgi:ABC-type oligopeptide transport system ATPase subunit
VTETNGSANGQALLQVKDLRKHFQIGRGTSLKAVDGISVEIEKGETLGLVGESGCGKTTVGRVLVRLYEPSGGEIFYNGDDITKVEGDDTKRLHRKMQMIFQDPQASLNPRMVVSDIVAEGIDIHGLARNKRERLERVHELLDTVGLNKEHANRYPHEFSGGQRQRLGVARALAVDPEFIVADEPVSALDVSIQAQVINLMRRLQEERGLTYLFISHDLSVVKYISDRVGVMYLGQLVEMAYSDELYENPLHPYTRSLLSAVPVPDPDYESSGSESSSRGISRVRSTPLQVPVPDALPPGGGSRRPRGTGMARGKARPLGTGLPLLYLTPMVPPVLRSSSERLASDRAPSLLTADRDTREASRRSLGAGNWAAAEGGRRSTDRSTRDVIATFLIVAFEYESEALGAALRSMLLTVGFVVPWRTPAWAF